MKALIREINQACGLRDDYRTHCSFERMQRFADPLPWPTSDGHHQRRFRNAAIVASVSLSKFQNPLPQSRAINAFDAGMSLAHSYLRASCAHFVSGELSHALSRQPKIQTLSRPAHTAPQGGGSDSWLPRRWAEHRRCQPTVEKSVGSAKPKAVARQNPRLVRCRTEENRHGARSPEPPVQWFREIAQMKNGQQLAWIAAIAAGGAFAVGCHTWSINSWHFSVQVENCGADFRLLRGACLGGSYLFSVERAENRLTDDLLNVAERLGIGDVPHWLAFLERRAPAFVRSRVDYNSESIPPHQALVNPPEYCQGSSCGNTYRSCFQDCGFRRRPIRCAHLAQGFRQAIACSPILPRDALDR